MSDSAIRVLIVDDHEVVRAGLAALFSRTPDLVVVGTVGRAEDALSMLDTVEPDVVLLDYSLPGLTGGMACSQILKRRPSTAVLMLTSTLDDGVLVFCLAAGARGYLLKNSDGPDLVAGVRAVAKGRSVMAPEALDTLCRWIRDSHDAHGNATCLEPDEVAALSLASQGLINREIARRMQVPEGVVKAFLDGAVRKLGSDDPSGAVLAGIRRGVI